MATPDIDNIASHLYLIFADHVPLCGCGDPQAGRVLVHQLLKLAPYYAHGHAQQAEALCGTTGAFQVVIGLLTHAELLEHGTSQRGSWITDRGRWVLWAIEQIGGIDALDAHLEQTGYPHDWDAEKHAMQDCTNACWTIPTTED